MTKMTHITRGQPVLACPGGSVEPSSNPTADKWALLDALTHAREVFGLNHRTLSVLRALMSFFPERELPNQQAVVFPSNRAICDRLNGMPESTLRRHLATLVRQGLIARQDSANRKRFARFGGLAFGFDLSPLTRAATTILSRATAALEEQAKIKSLKAEIAAMRQMLIEDSAAPADLLEKTRLACRRKLPSATLDAIKTRLAAHLPTVQLSAADTQNERHIQTTDESYSVKKQNPANNNSKPLT